MPIYEYYCKICDLTFEYFMRSRDEKVLCPRCGKDDVKRLFSTFACSFGGESLSTASGCSTCSSHNCSQCG
ncbi:MAG: FmdB family zinc ribbon protein [Spirochaetota bacterium]